MDNNRRTPPGPDRQDFQTVHIHSFTEFESLKSEWNALSDALTIPFARHEWFHAAYQTLHTSETLHVVCIRNHGKLIAACPLVRGRFPKYTIPGAMLVGEWGYPVLDKIEAAAPLLEALQQLGVAVVLNRLHGDHPMKTGMNKAPIGASFSFVRAAPSAHRLTFDGSWDAFLTDLPSSRRKQLRRKARQAERMGAINFRVVSPEQSAVTEPFDSFLKIEHASWKGDKDVSLRRTQQIRRFFRAIANNFAAQSELKFFFLELENQPVAGQMALQLANRLWGLKIGYDQTFHRFSPGLLLDQKVFEYCFQSNINGYEFLGNANMAENFWNPDLQYFQNIHFYPKSIMGLIGLSHSAGASVMRRIRHRKAL